MSDVMMKVGLGVLSGLTVMAALAIYESYEREQVRRRQQQLNDAFEAKIRCKADGSPVSDVWDANRQELAGWRVSVKL